MRNISAAFARCRELDRRLARDVAAAYAFAGDAEMDALFDAYINDRIMPTTVHDARKLRSTMHGMGFWVQTMISWDQLAHPRHVRADLGRFTRPVLVLHGDSDYLPPGMAAQYAATFPAARAVEIPGAGHLLWVDQPEVYAREILGFLRQPA